MILAEDKIKEFKLDLVKARLSYEEIFQRHIVDGNTFFFQSFLEDTSKEYKTKSVLSEYLGVHINEVIFVGSAKLGFSLNPRNLFNEFDSKFNETRVNKDKSDLDIAIVSKALFESISKNIFDFTDAFKNKWDSNEYYFGDKLNEFKVPICFKYFEYFSKGWFRPDMKPKGYDFCVKNSYEELKRVLFDSFKRKIGIGIYQDWHFFKHYHINNLKNLSYRVKTETI